jgi:conjugation system TraG family ATPase
MPVDISRVFPITAIKENVLVGANGDITYGFRAFFPQIYTMDAQQYVQLSKGINDVLKGMPPGTFFMKQDFVYLHKYKSKYDLVNDLTSLEDLKQFDTRAVSSCFSNIYLSFNRKGVIKINSSTNPVNRLRKYLTDSSFKDVDKFIGEMTDYYDQFINQMESLNGVTLVAMKAEELAKSLSDFCNLEYLREEKRGVGEVLQPVISKPEFKIGNQYVSVISMIEEGDDLDSYKAEPITSPGSIYRNGNSYNNNMKLGTSMSFPLVHGLPINHIYTVGIEILDNEKASLSLSRESMKLNPLESIKHKGAAVKKREIDGFLDAVAEENKKIVRVWNNVIVHDEDMLVVKRNANVVRQAYSNMNRSAAWVENEEAFNLFYASMPGNGRYNYRDFMTIIESASSYISKESHYVGDAHGKIFADRFGTPVAVDTWNSREITNKNAVILGPSGTGKSFLINKIISESLKVGAHVVVVDIGYSYVKSCEISGGMYFDSADKDKLRFNIFACEKVDGKFTPSDMKIVFVMNVMKTIWSRPEDKVNAEEEEILRDMVLRFYDWANEQSMEILTLINFYDFIDIYETEFIKKERLKYIDTVSLRLMLEIYTRGKLSYLMNSDSNIDISEQQFVVFDVKAIEKDPKIFPIVMLVIIDLVVRKMEKLPKSMRKEFFIDEALNFLAGDLGDYAAHLYRTIRKEGGSISIATQSVKFFDTIPPMTRESILGNTDTKWILDHSKYTSLHEALRTILSLTDHDMNVLRDTQSTDQYREFFVKMGNLSRLFRLGVSKFTEGVYTTSASDVELINTYTEKFNGNRVMAIRQWEEEKKKEVVKNQMNGL